MYQKDKHVYNAIHVVNWNNTETIWVIYKDIMDVSVTMAIGIQ